MHKRKRKMDTEGISQKTKSDMYSPRNDPQFDTEMTPNGYFLH